MPQIESFLVSIQEHLATDFLFRMDDSALATLISIGYAVVVFAISQYQSHLSFLYASDIGPLLIEQPTVRGSLAPHIRRMIRRYKHLLSLIRFIRNLAIFYFTASVFLLFSWMWDKNAILERPIDFPLSYKLPCYLLHNSSAVLTVIPYLLLLIFYLWWIGKPGISDASEYLYILVYWLRYLRFLIRRIFKLR